MKKYLLITFAAGSFLLAGASIAAAAEPMKMNHDQMVEMCKTMGEEDCRLMMREMVKNKALHKVMAEELKKDKDFRETFGNLTTGGG
jgi:hypothetical protein